MKKILFVLAGLVFLSCSSIIAGQLFVGDFSKGSLKDWKVKEFRKKTSYRLLKLDNRNILMAKSNSAASGLVKEIKVDLRKYPYLNWSWRIKNKLNTGNEKIKSGDDYAARIYVVIDGGIFIWNTKAINYVWANESKKLEIWENAFAGKNAMMMAIRNNQDETGNWYFEKRNLYEDMKKVFGKEVQFIDTVALMTDTDNSNGIAEAYYGDIYFSEK